jgi:hypothetical protein
VDAVVALHRVGVAHQHHRRGVVLLPEVGDHGQHLLHADAQRQRGFAGGLDHGAVGHRIGEGHAELDHVGPCFDHAVHELGRDVGEGEAGGDVGNQRPAAVFFQCLEGGGDAAH